MFTSITYIIEIFYPVIIKKQKQILVNTFTGKKMLTLHLLFHIFHKLFTYQGLAFLQSRRWPRRERSPGQASCPPSSSSGKNLLQTEGQLKEKPRF